MRITIVCDVLGEANNGTTLAALNLINYMKEAGHDVTVVCSDEDKRGREGYVIVPTIDLGKFINRILKRNGVSLAKPDNEALENAIKDADVVHVQLPFALGCAATKIARRLDKPLCASFHCQAENIASHIGLMNSTLFSDMTYKAFYRLVYRYCDRIHYPTAFIRDVFEQKTRPTHGEVISNGVNEKFLGEHDGVRLSDKFTIVCSGRYCKEKDQKTLIDAVARCRHRDEITVVLAGDGPDREKLVKRVEKRGIDCIFRFFSREDLIGALHGADLYVHSAVIEIEAISCLEAIASGLVPVICNSPRSATRFFASAEDNLYEPGDIDGLAAKIDYWFEHPAERAARSAEYREHFSNLSQQQSMKGMEEMFRGAIEDHLATRVYKK